MFWPWNRWGIGSPSPWGGSKWNTPVEMRESSFAAAKSHMWPKYEARFDRDFGNGPPPQYWVSPSRPYGAISKRPGDAMQAVASADAHLRELARSALMKQAAGIAVSVDEGRALMAVHLPPISVPRERTGPGVYPDWDVPFSESRVPDAVYQRYREILTPIREQRRAAVGEEIRRLEQIRSTLERDSVGSGRPGRGRGPR